MKENIIADKSKGFALRIIKLYRFLQGEKQEYVLSKQVLKERLREVEKMPLLFLKKIYIQWFRSDLSWTFNTGEYPVLFSISNFINQMMIVLFHS